MGSSPAGRKYNRHLWKPFCEGKSEKTTCSIDSACSRIKTHGLPFYLPSFAKRILLRTCPPVLGDPSNILLFFGGALT